MIVICGAGAMGEALLAGWLASGIAASEIAIVEPDETRANDVANRHGVTAIKPNEAVGAEVIVLAVKPHHVKEALGSLRPSAETLVVSIAAGVTIETIEDAAPGAPVVRVMPNTPALVGKGMAGIAAGSQATDAHLHRVIELMSAVGETLVCPESQLDALTAVSGSGPAYLFYVAEAMIEAAVHLGFARADATLLVNQTLLGSATMLVESGESATVLRERVTSPAGTTAAALAVLDDLAVRSAFAHALRAARDRGAEMASGAK